MDLIAAVPFLEGALSADEFLAQLEAQRDQLARLEQERADLQIEIEAFRLEYTARVGEAQAELEALEIHIAEYRLRNELLRLRRGEIDAARLEYEIEWQLRGRREQFAGYQESVRRAAYAADVQRPAPAASDAPALKSIYRELAKRIHPDLASDANERGARGQLMAQANEAYARFDAQALQAMLAQATGLRPEPVTRSADQLRAEMARLDRIIAEVRGEIAELNRSAWMSMKLDASLARSRGLDWFANARRQIEAQVAQRRIELDGLVAEFRDLVHQFGLV